MSRRVRRTWLAPLAAVALLAGLAAASAAAAPAEPRQAAVPYATIEGTGSTWSELIVQKWIADVDANGMKVVYTGGGSTKGRKDFSQSSVDFAISEIPYQGTDERGQADTSDRDYAYLPMVAGGTAFTYQLKIGNQRVENLRLSGETIAKIFTDKITNWNDPAITEDNNGREFPSLPITPVVRSDGSGTTAQFTTWLDKEYPSIWRPFFGRSGLTSYYPSGDGGSRQVKASGSDQVMNTIKGFAGNGTIGYVEYSYPVNADYPVVKVLNKSGYFVEPTQYNVAVALTKAKINQNRGSQLYLTQILDDVYRNPDPRAYPLSSYSYLIMPTASDDQRMTTSKRQTLADFIYYSLCAGQTSAGAYGYSPLPLNLVEAGFEQVAKLKQADSGVDLTDRDVESCNNPTFDGKNKNKNVLAEIAPMPADCDKVGEGPCGTATGENEPSTDDPNAPGGETDEEGNENGPPEIDPETGLEVDPDSVSTDTGTSNDEIYANPTLVADRPADARTFGWLAVAQLFALVLVPGLLVAFLRRRRSAKGVR